MFQIDNDTSSQNLPAPSSAKTPGYFVDGDPAKGIPATILPAEFMNMLMMEFINLVVAAGLTPSKSDYTQLSKAIPALISKLATVDWSKITNVPTTLVKTGTSPSLTGVELSGPTPYLDFHFGSDAADYNVRLINNADGTLSLLNKAGTTLWSVKSSVFDLSVPLLLRQAMSAVSQGAGMSIALNSADNTLTRFGINHTDTTFNLCNFSDAGAYVANVLSVLRSTGVISLLARPVFAGNTPWDSGNFTPSGKADKATTLGGYGITDAVAASTYNTFVNTTYPTFVNATNNTLAGKQANLGFTPVRQGGGAAQLGNIVQIGWDGAGCRVQIDSLDLGRMLTEVNYTNYFPAGIASVGVYNIGSFGLFTFQPGSAVNAGTAVAGSNLRPAPTNGYVGNAYGAPPGTWVCCGTCNNNTSTGATTLFQRIS
jgi:hypothetical protein